MEKIEELKYKEYITNFFVTEMVKKFLKENKVDYGEIVPDEYHWYEVELFEMIDGENFGNEFEVVYYGIVEKTGVHIDQSEESFEDTFEHNSKKIIGDWIKVISQTSHCKSFAIKYKILKK